MRLYHPGIYCLVFIFILYSLHIVVFFGGGDIMILLSIVALLGILGCIL